MDINLCHQKQKITKILKGKGLAYVRDGEINIFKGVTP